MGFKSEEQIFGVRELFRPQTGEPDVDIVAVHGLGGHATKTWSASEKSCWLSDDTMLPRYMKTARILAYGYNSNVSSLGQKRTSKDRILQHALTLVQHLQSDRSIEEADRRPIIFLCHSLGGIILKRAIAYSSSCTSPGTSHLQSIYTSTSAILFFGTPHHGSNKAKLLSSLQKIMSMSIPSTLFRTESSLVRSLEEESEILQNINDQFSPLMRRFHIFFFWEQEPLNLKYTRDYIVDESSAAPIIDNTERCGLTGDHRRMCKFEHSSDQNFRTVVAAIKRYAASAPATIAKRWEEAESLRRDRRMREAIELTGDNRFVSQSVTSQTKEYI